MEKFELPEGLSALGDVLGDLMDGMLKQMQEEVRPKISLESIRAVLWYFGDRELGQEPGGFVSRLLDAMAHADGDNLVKLANEYQELAFCVEQAKNAEDGMDWMRSRVLAHPSYVHHRSAPGVRVDDPSNLAIVDDGEVR